MMKILRLFLLIALLCLMKIVVVAQKHYSFETKTKVYDAYSSYFSAARVEGNQVLLQVRDFIGLRVWIDTLNQDNALDRIDSISFCQFGNSNKYCIFLQQRLSDDSLRISYSTYTYDTYNVLSTFTQNIRSDEVFKVTKAGLGIYLFTNRFDSGGMIKHDVYRIYAGMKMDDQPVKTDVTTGPVYGVYDYSVNFNGSEIVTLRNDGTGKMFAKHYDFGMNPVGAETSTNSVSDYSFTVPYVPNFKKDSLFIFYYGYKQNTIENAWILSSTNDRLDAYVSTAYPYETGAGKTFYGVVDVMDHAGDYFVLGAYNDGSLNHPQKIFVYDYDFNLKCEIPLYFQEGSLNRLKVINDRIYICSDNGQSFDMYQIENCSIPSSLTKVDASLVGFTIYPNPANGKVSLELHQNFIGKTISVTSALGQLVGTYQANSTNVELDLSGVSGIYFVEVDGFVRRVSVY